MSKSKKITIALAGNPNVGKSVLFNELTGGKQHVGNWPGKTVEKKEGHFFYKDYEIKIVDLPGTYSLTAYSTEELIARNYIVEGSPDVVIHVVDSTNLERNLYLTTQLIELGAKIVLDLNMSDLAEKQGLQINEKKISQLLKIPVVKTISPKRIGIFNLLDKTIELAEKKFIQSRQIIYGKELEDHLGRIEKFIENNINLPTKYRPQWIALKLLEKDEEIVSKIKSLKNGNVVINEVQRHRKHLQGVLGENINDAFASARYGFISGLLKESIVSEEKEKITISDKIDKIVTNKFLGIPIFLVAMWLMFQITFSIGGPLARWIDSFFGWAGVHLTNWLTLVGSPHWFISLIVNGLLGGVGTILVFVPNIFLLFLMIALLEDSGYMARAAFVMDRLMHKIGLHGKSFIPMILGFGCNVPAIMATRTLRNKRDRILTILIIPLMSCSARLPIYILFVSVFFTQYQGLIIFSLYLLGIILAVLMGLLFKRIFFKGLSAPFVMELPPYRLPTIKGSLIHMWERGSLFLKKAGTIILIAVIIIWALASFPLGVEYGSEQSIVGVIGKTIAPLFKPCGFGNWQSSVALFFGAAAKEVVVGTFGTLFGAKAEALGQAISGHFTPLSALSFMVFSLLYMPCIATIAVIKRETNSWRWPLFTIFYTTILAWIMSFLVYQIGSFLGF